MTTDGRLRRLAPEPLKRWVRSLRSSQDDVASERAVLEPAYDYMREHGIQRAQNNALIVQRALDRGVAVSAGKKGRVQLSYGGRAAWFNLCNSNLNYSLAKRVASNKAITTALLRAQGVNAPENAAFGAGDLHRAWAWAEPILPVAVKPSRGQEGLLVHVAITDFAQFEHAFRSVAGAGFEVLVEKFVTGVDHRVTLINGAVAAATRRIPAHVLGDGKSTVGELVEAKNADRHARRNPVHRLLVLGEIEARYLSEHGLTVTSTPDAGQVVWLRGAANVSTGGDAIDATDDLTPEEIRSIERAVRALPGLRFTGVDVLLDRETRGEPWILEVNSRPSISPHHFPWEGQPRDVMTAVLEAMFPVLAAKTDAGSEGKKIHK